MKKEFYIIAIVIVLLFFINKFKSKSMDEFFNELVVWLKKKEGGISKDTTDLASVNVAPGTGGVHTNKGVTWKVYKDTLGTLATPERFLKMPDEDWLKVFINKYYSKSKNFSNNDVLNAYVAYWFWNGWEQKWIPPIDVSKILVSTDSNKNKLSKLVELRKKYYDILISKKPEQVKYKKGWYSVQDDYLKTFSKYL